MKTKIVTNDNDKIGLVLYGASQSNNPLKFKGLDIPMALDTPDAEQI
jgi:hypothetical protein